MIRLTRSKIHNLASDDAVFQRGLNYFKEKRITHAACSKNQKVYTFTVEGKQEYHVTIEETEEQDIEFSCNCPAMYDQKGACKHTVAAMFYLMQYQEASEKKTGSGGKNDSRGHKVIKYFIDAREPHYDKEVFHVEPYIELPGRLRTGNDPVFLSLRVGNSKFYRVQSLKRFLTEIKTKQPILLGKEFSYLPGESSFDQSSNRLLEELISYTEVLSLLDGENSTKLFQKAKIQLNQSLLVRVLSCMEGYPFTLKLSDKEFSGVTFQRADPPIEYDIVLQNDIVSMSYKEQERVIPLSADGSLLFRDNVIYLPRGRFMKTYLPFYSTLLDSKEPLIFDETDRNDFLEYVLPEIHDTLKVEIPEEVKDRYLTLPFSAKIYFDLFHGAVRATVYFRYGSYEFNCFDAPNTDGYILTRDQDQEENLCKRLEALSFEPHNGFYLLKNEDAIYLLFQEGLMNLSEYAELYSSDEFTKIRSARHSLQKIGLTMSSGEDFLQVDFGIDEISGEELRNILYSYRQKKRYHRLNDGSFIDLTDDSFLKVVNLLESINVSYRDIDKNGQVKLSKSYAPVFDLIEQESGITICKDEKFTEFLNRLTSPEERHYSVPSSIQIELRGYQKTGFSWLRMLSDNCFGGILADDMGLGKTLQAITYMVSVLETETFSGIPFLVVCPTSLLYNWLDEVETYAPCLRTRIIQGTPEERKSQLTLEEPCDLVITSYPLLRRDLPLYREMKFHTVFIDEAQFIKNAMTGNAKSVKELSSKVRFALTGTPLENSLSELWSIFDFILPGYLFSYSRFAKFFERPIAKGETKPLTRLNHRVKPFLMRRMKKDVLSELPEKFETKKVCELTEEQRLLYVSYAKQAKEEITNEIQKVGVEKSRMQILAALTRLRQICCHPGMFLENYEGGSGKLSLFMQIADDLRKNDHRVLVFSQFTSMLDILQDALNESDFSFFYLCGATKPADRQEYVKRFNAGERDLFLISLKAGGTGLNLTGADTVIHIDPWWNPAVEDQASDRAHRIGQTKNVHVIRLLTKGTIEEKIFKLQQKKQDLFHAVIEAGETFLTGLSKEEIEELFSDIL